MPCLSSGFSYDRGQAACQERVRHPVLDETPLRRVSLARNLSDEAEPDCDRKACQQACTIFHSARSPNRRPSTINRLAGSWTSEKPVENPRVAAFFHDELCGMALAPGPRSDCSAHPP